MGTNFFFFTKNKEAAQRYFGESWFLVDDPELGYSIHIAKISCGWLPLFQAHEKCRSVEDLLNAFSSGEFYIYDDARDRYTWEEFDAEVLHHNGGIDGAIPKKTTNPGKKGLFSDPNMPDHVPVSHFEYGNGRYENHFFTDPKGYEFSEGDFR